MSDYIPIDCSLYSRYELAVMHRQRLKLVWRSSDGIVHMEILLPMDLRTRDHAEYLLLRRQSGEALEMRLDQIVRVEFC
jgi:Rho-binding antiterminator